MCHEPVIKENKDFVKCVNYYLRYVNKGTLSEMNLQENLVTTECDTVLLSFQGETHDVCLCAHNHDSVSLVFILIFKAWKSGIYLNGLLIWGVEGGEGG